MPVVLAEIADKRPSLSGWAILNLGIAAVVFGLVWLWKPSALLFIPASFWWYHAFVSEYIDHPTFADLVIDELGVNCATLGAAFSTMPLAVSLLALVVLSKRFRRMIRAEFGLPIQ